MALGSRSHTAYLANDSVLLERAALIEAQLAMLVERMAAEAASRGMFTDESVAELRRLRESAGRVAIHVG